MGGVIDSVAEGHAELLTVSDICKLLCISRTTLNRWVSNHTGVGETFPQRDIRIGNKLCWERETFKRWLSKRANKKD